MPAWIERYLAKTSSPITKFPICINKRTCCITCQPRQLCETSCQLFSASNVKKLILSPIPCLTFVLFLVSQMSFFFSLVLSFSLFLSHIPLVSLSISLSFSPSLISFYFRSTLFSLFSLFSLILSLTMYLSFITILYFFSRLIYCRKSFLLTFSLYLILASY